MQSLFELAIAFLVMMTFINGMFFVFAGPLTGVEFNYPSQDDLVVSQEEIKATTVTENTAKEGDAFAAIFSFVSVLVGTITGAIGAVSSILTLLMTFGNAWSFVLQTIFGGTGLLWVFLSLTVVNFVNLLQLGSIAYIVLYSVSAVRGGSV